MAIAHNGIIPYTKGIIEGHRTCLGKDVETLEPSDTMEAIKNLLYPLSSIPGWQDDEKIRAIISSITGSSRLALLSAGGGIATFGDFVEDFGCQWSNGSYKIAPPVIPLDKDGQYRSWLYDDIEDAPARPPLLNYSKELRMDRMILGNRSRGRQVKP
jgi:hypothetical protein